jgi:hypothetical protein
MGLQQAPASDTDALQFAHPDKLLKFAHSNLSLLPNRPLATDWRCVRKAKLVCAKNTKWLLSNPHKLQNFA